MNPNLLPTNLGLFIRGLNFFKKRAHRFVATAEDVVVPEEEQGDEVKLIIKIYGFMQTFDFDSGLWTGDNAELSEVLNDALPDSSNFEYAELRFSEHTVEGVILDHLKNIWGDGLEVITFDSIVFESSCQ